MAPSRALVFLVLLVAAGTVRASVELGHDSFETSGANYQGGFAPGEIAAVRFVPPAGPLVLERVRFLLGGAAGTRDVVLHVWDDAGTDVPGVGLFSDTYP